MAGVTLGLEVAFYLYPCGLFATLFLSQLIQYRPQSIDNKAARDVDDPERLEKVQRFYARLIWFFQLLLSPLLVRFFPTPTRPDDQTSPH